MGQAGSRPELGFVIIAPVHETEHELRHTEE